MNGQNKTSLYFVPTPIGNLDDITLRAIEVLKNADIILAEDTRTSGKLLSHLGIKKPMLSFHIFNEQKVLGNILEKLKEGKRLALISDAGTPGISDPGFLLSRACRAKNIPFECLPGPTALIPALVKSGLPSDRFIFEGFLPHKKGKRKQLESLKEEERTMIFYESPHRILKTLIQMEEIFGADRKASVSREISKLYEETINGTLEEIIFAYQDKKIKGEFVIVIEGYKTK